MSFNVVAPNGVQMSGVIVDDEREFELYKLLKLDVFDNTPEKKANVVEVVIETPKKNSGRSTKK